MQLLIEMTHMQQEQGLTSALRTIAQKGLQ
jgi:hypothetical protein